MSDDFDFDDSFAIDDSFLKEVDNIAAKASKGNSNVNTGLSRNATLPLTSLNKGWTGPQRSISSSSRLPPPPPKLPLQKSSSSSKLSPQDKGAAARGLAFASFQAQQPPKSPSKARPLNNVPSSRLQRSVSGATNFQTHLNFRKDNQTTRGKRWDRTVFAASGRKIVLKNEGAMKARQGKDNEKGKGKRSRDWENDEEEEEEEDDWGEPLAPDPKARVDTSRPYDPPKHSVDMSTVGTYIYPTNRPKRDYQFEIVRACFTDNCLVALPTGLGKTFVAGVVMLNFYRWFPTGKIVFLAPTKPLVNQQIEACQMTCGIPSKDAAVMTGQSISAKERTKMWEERRVFYCTPQTLYNDLVNSRLDPRDIVLAVFDEAHKASGSYAYTTILAFLTAHQPYFRVLALTATPGADVPKVQGVVDALHISRIEIREAEDPAISKYMNEKKTERHVVPMTDKIDEFRDRWAALMKPYISKLVDKDILNERDLDAKRLKPYRLTAKRQEIGRDRSSGLMWAMGTLQSLEKMARGMTHLLEFSLGMFHTTLIEISGNVDTTTGKKSGSKGNSNALKNNTEFVKLLRDVESEMNMIRIGAKGRSKADSHPKMAKTMELLLAHFSQAADDEDIHGIKNDTRAMVFCSLRSCVMEVVAALNEHPDLLKATKFVGQSQGKEEKDKGFNQKEQKKTIQDFKDGKFNILVSTSIGEEGLDIGEVDFVVIYDMPKQSIKLLQRIGRTGRKRSGQVHVLMSENREDANWDSAQQTHREIQEEILHSRNLELFEDVERLLPKQFPICEEKEMPVDPWDPEDQKRKISNVDSPARKSGGKEKGNDATTAQRGDSIPDGAHSGFKSVAELLKEQLDDKGKGGGAGKGKGRKRKAPTPIRSESEGEGVKEDEELLYGPITSLANRTIKLVPKTRKSRAKKGKKEQDEEDDWEVKKRKREEEEAERKAKEEARQTQEALDFFNTIGPIRRGPLTPPESPASSESSNLGSPSPKKNGSLGVNPPFSPNTDESDPNGPKGDRKADGARSGGVDGKLDPDLAKLVGFSQVDAIDLSWEESDDDLKDAPTVGKKNGKGPGIIREDEDETLVPSGQIRRATTTKQFMVEEEDEETLIPSAPVRRLGLGKPKTSQSSLGDRREISRVESAVAMPPPPVPAHRTSSPATRSSAAGTPILESTQFPVRRPGARRLRVIPSSSERDSEREGVRTEASSPLVPVGPAAAVPSSSSPPLIRGRRAKASKRAVAEYLDVDVEVSGSESSDEPLTDEETESDRLFAGRDFAPTQAIKGYDQRAIHRAGLSTQAGSKAGLGFRARRDEEKFLGKARKPVYVTDSEGSGESENEYELGSFVVQDEDDLGFEGTQSDPPSCT